jgi:hypothetical protein
MRVLLRSIGACAALATVAALAIPARAQSPASTARAGEYRVQVGAFRTETRARTLCDPLIDQGQALVVAPDRARDGSTLFVCRSAEMLALPQAKAMAERLRNEAKQEAVVARVAPGAVARERAAPGARTLDPALRRDFDRFLNERQGGLSPTGDEGRTRAEFERFLAEHPELLPSQGAGGSPPKAAGPTGNAEAPSGTSGAAPSSASPGSGKNEE